MYRDLRHDTPAVAQKKFHWSPEQSDLTQHVRAVATIPLYRKRTGFRGHIKHKYFGVLNIDATNDVGVEFLADAAIQQQIMGFAQFVQLSLG
jgi:hypothetical protein